MSHNSEAHSSVDIYWVTSISEAYKYLVSHLAFNLAEQQRFIRQISRIIFH